LLCHCRFECNLERCRQQNRRKWERDPDRRKRRPIIASNVSGVGQTINNSIRANAAQRATKMEGRSFPNVALVFKLTSMDLWICFLSIANHSLIIAVKKIASDAAGNKRQ